MNISLPQPELLAGRRSYVADAFDRSSRLVTIASLGAALVFLVSVTARTWHSVPLIAAVGFTGGAFSGRYSHRVEQVLLSTVYVFPAVMTIFTGWFYVGYYAPVMASLLGVMLSEAPARRWALPFRFQLPLCLWALVVAMSWPVVALRETDFHFSFAIPGTGISPIAIVPWIANVAAIQLTGILWLDSLCARAKRIDGDPVRPVFLALLGSWIVAGAIGAYQCFVDLRFVNPGYWVGLSRASGGLADANAFGVLAALWVAAAAGIAARARNAAIRGAAGVSLALSIVGVWASGSRTGLAALILVAAGVTLGVWHLYYRAALRPARAVAAMLSIAVLGVGVFLFAASSRRVEGPVARLARVLPPLDRASIERTARDLWERDGYGTVAVSFIRAFPATGVGIGSFHHFVQEAARADGVVLLAADNAQNWYRHELAEFGVVGSIGWALWCVLLVNAALKSVAASASRDAFYPVAALFALGVVSLVGMPGQDFAIAFTVFAFAFWLIVTAGPTAVVNEPASSRRWLVPAAAWSIALLYLGLSIAAAEGPLRIPFRAARFDFDYTYGVHLASPGDGWTDQHGVIVPKASTPWVKLTYWIEHPDAGTKPVAVDIWRDHERIVHRKLWNNVHVTTYLSVPGSGKRFVLETKVDRTFTEPGTKEERGLNLQWEFVDLPVREF